MLHWPSIWWWGREGIAICYSFKGDQKFLYDCLQFIARQITQDTTHKIVDTLLTIISG